MKHRSFLAIAIVAIAGLAVSTQSSIAAAPAKTKLLWSESFKGSAGAAPSSKIWNTVLGDGSAQNLPGWGNGERELYTKSSLALTGTTTDGLAITASRPPAADQPLCYYGPCDWYSGKIDTSKKVSFQYGLIEARIKMPAGGGTWPAFWMLGTSILAKTSWPNCGEIDIVETQGNNPLNVLGTVHGPGYSGGSAKTDTTYSKTDLSLDDHTFGVLWLPIKISWLLDGKVYFTVTKSDVAPNPWPFNNKFYMILNLAMGGNLGGDIDPTINSTTMNVQWIHYSSVNGQGKVTYN